MPPSVAKDSQLGAGLDPTQTSHTFLLSALSSPIYASRNAHCIPRRSGCILIPLPKEATVECDHDCYDELADMPGWKEIEPL